mmetsp:Transcript_48839/g.81079  ORF Transcript_48839/g.81079 Transcript_48839/m.81079 type:complete len:307 (-) Transcript_48839:541-1461(-)
MTAAMMRTTALQGNRGADNRTPFHHHQLWIVGGEHQLESCSIAMVHRRHKLASQSLLNARYLRRAANEQNHANIALLNAIRVHGCFGQRNRTLQQLLRTRMLLKLATRNHHLLLLQRVIRHRNLMLRRHRQRLFHALRHFQKLRHQRRRRTNIAPLVLALILVNHNIADDGVKIDTAETRIADDAEHLTVDASAAQHGAIHGTAANVEREEQFEVIRRRRAVVGIGERGGRRFHDQLAHTQADQLARAANRFTLPVVEERRDGDHHIANIRVGHTKLFAGGVDEMCDHRTQRLLGRNIGAEIRHPQ